MGTGGTGEPSRRTSGDAPPDPPAHDPPPGRASSDAPAAPDGSERRVGVLRTPDPAPVRGPAAGVPDLADVGLLLGLRADGRKELDPPRAGIPPHAHGRRSPHEPLPNERVQFQHTSELRFARLLDFYGVAWVYEPDEYPIEWDPDGTPTAWFRPDFYLPAFDLYIEITTSQQRLVTRKNRKLRLLRAHHPQVRCKLFYQRDYLALVRKYGLDEDLGDRGEG